MPSNRDPAVSIIIVHVRGFDSLYNALKSVFESEYDNLEVVLVDNGSTDGSTQRAERAFEGKLRVLRTLENLGFVRACNYGLRRITSIYAVLLNDDTVVDPKWLARLVEEAETDSSIAACQPKLRMLSNPSFFEYNGACGGMIDLCGVPFTRGRLFDRTEEDLGQYDKTVDVFWASGAAMFLRLRAVEEVGYLDDLFHFQMEEIDLSWRLRMRGYRVVSVPSSIVYHLGGATPVPRTSFLKHRNSLLTLVKNYSMSSLARFFPIRMLLDFTSLIYLAAKGKRRFGMDALRSYVWIVLNLRLVIGSRRAAQLIRLVSDTTITSNMAKPTIALQYYLMKRHIFSQLSGLPLHRDSYLNKETNDAAKTGRLLEVGSVF
ncbi:glycosyltransferase family 2 protein [Candidatus Bathyarchaeota archaeon]|nr:MAG: glycosyltransferase family 2 protein [Candidatus Bathyarchaeota archaeon]